MTVTATFDPATGILTLAGDSIGSSVTIKRDALGVLLLNGGTIPVQGGIATVANTLRIEWDALAGNDVFTLDEGGGPLPPAIIVGSGGTDSFVGGSGADRFFGGDDRDGLFGNSGADELFGGNGDDTLGGGGGNDRVSGGSGNDTFFHTPGDGNDVIDGDEDFDVLEIVGSSASEQFTIEANGARVRVRGTSANPFTLDVGTTEVIRINANDGHDTVSAADNLGAMVAVEANGGAGNDTLSGGGGADRLGGGDDQDSLFGKDGADILDGGAGHDILVGGAGNDQMTGGTGNDEFIWKSGDGSDTIEGGVGSDAINIFGSDSGEDINLVRSGTRIIMGIGPHDHLNMGTMERINISAFGGDDIISAVGVLGVDSIHIDAGAGDDVISGSDGSIDEKLQGGDGNDVIDGNKGADQVELGAGDDTFLWDTGDGGDSVQGGDGFDTARFYGSGDETYELSANSGSVRLVRDSDVAAVSLTAVERIEILGQGGADTIVIGDLTGSGVTQVEIDLAPLVGGPGPNPVPGDTVWVNGGTGNDVIQVLPGTFSVTVTGLSAAVTIRGSEAERDYLYIDGGGGDDVITADTGDLWATTALALYGGAGDDTLTGGNGNDAIIGDLLQEGAGNDVIRGGLGNDNAYLGAGDDRFIWNAGDGIDMVEGGNGFDTLEFNGAEGGESYSISAAGDRVYLVYEASPFPMDLDDVEAIDLDTGGGADSVVVGNLAGTDITGLTVALGASTDTFEASNAMTIPLIVFGDAGNDFLTGGGGNDSLHGGGDDDHVYGGDGTDTAHFSGMSLDYSIALVQPGYYRLSDLRSGSPDGTDILREVELFAFADGVFTLAQLLNRQPLITSNGGGASATVDVAENATPVTVVTATDPDAGTTLSYSISGGADAALFQIDAMTGALSFKSAPDFEAPLDANGDNLYKVVVRASDGSAFDEQAITVEVNNVDGVNVIGNGNVTLTGTPEADTFRYQSGLVTIDGKAATDILDFTLFGAAVWVDLAYTGTPNEVWTRDTTDLNSGTWREIADVTNVENVVGSLHSDLIRGDGNHNIFFYTGGLDRFDGRAGSDTADFSRFGSAVWVDLAYTGTANEAWTRDNATVTTGTWREIADLTAMENVTGTAFADDLRGDGNDNRLVGGDGDDRLNGRGGSDVLDGGNGTDTAVFANAFAGYTITLVGSDIVVTGEGTDTVLDNVELFQFADGTRTRAQVLGAPGPAGFSDDADVVTLPLSGGSFDALGGDDTIRYAAGTNGSVAIDGGAGTDTLDFRPLGSAVWVDLQFTSTANEVWTRDTTTLDSGTWREIADISQVENVIGTVHSDLLRGDGNDNVFFYTGGRDRIDGRAGTDTADFSLFGSAVWVDLQWTTTANEAWTRDTANLTTGNWREIADLAGIESVVGTAFADDLRGDANANRLVGGAGSDTLTGRGGNDTFVFRAGFGQDTIADFAGNGAASGDVVALSFGAAFDSYAEVMAAGSQIGSNVVFDFGGGNTLTLNNVTLAGLHQDDFLFT